MHSDRPQTPQRTARGENTAELRLWCFKCENKKLLKCDNASNKGKRLMKEKVTLQVALQVKGYDINVKKLVEGLFVRRERERRKATSGKRKEEDVGVGGCFTMLPAQVLCVMDDFILTRQGRAGPYKPGTPQGCLVSPQAVHCRRSNALTLQQLLHCLMA